jgi:uncharacterized protein (DUF1501 family)
MTKLDRRSFLLGSAGGLIGASAMVGTLTAGMAHAADTSGYKALICVNLKGGMDHGDTIIPTDAENFNLLREQREGLFNAYGGANASARGANSLLPINAANAADFGGRTFGLPREMAGLHSMFESGEAAIIANAGPLLEPVTRADMEADRVRLPKRLFSHNDQQSTWMSLATEGAREGWGGKFADAFLRSDSTANPLYAAVTTSGNDVFLAGQIARQFRAPGNSNGLDVDITTRRYMIGGNARYDEARRLMDEYFRDGDMGHQNLFKQDVVSSSAAGIANVRDYRDALVNAVPIATEFPDSRLGRQLESIANSINTRNFLDVSRQVFYASTGGFDTHSGQASSLPNRQGDISASFDAFRRAMVEIGAWNDVILFTMSDFGRTLADNGDGTDHGWGGHHFAIGGDVVGGRIYGTLPQPIAGSEEHTNRRARMIPSVSVGTERSAAW